MKFRLLILGIFISLATTAQMKQSPFVFGPKIGLQANKLYIPDKPAAVDPKLNIQYQAGVFGRLNFGQKFSIQPEATFQILGGVLKTPSEKHTFHYLSTPIMVQASPFKGFFLEAGPMFSWALNQGYKKPGITQFGPDQATDVAAVLGARIDLLDAFSMFSVNLRFVRGFNNVSTRTYNTSTLELQNRSFQLGITYNFSEYYKWWRKYGDKKKK